MCLLVIYTLSTSRLFRVDWNVTDADGSGRCLLREGLSLKNLRNSRRNLIHERRCPGR
jgi:hypothetical protein